MAEDPVARYEHTDLLGETQRGLLLQEWNDTETEYPRESCIHELFTSQVASTLSQVAVVHDGERLTYAELNRERTSSHIIRRGLWRQAGFFGWHLHPAFDRHGC